jgi:CIC family chloride channel protein
MIAVGLLMGLAGFYFNGIFGIGYETINNILAGKEIWNIVLILIVLKFILVPLILYSGGFGGLFAPTLFIGAGMGYLYAFALNYFWGVQLDTAAYVLVGMGAMLGGVNTIPITAILVIFEMTQNYTFILPLMLAVIFSTTIVQIFLKGSSIHVQHLEREGYKIASGRDTNILRSIFVADVMKDDILLIPEDTSISKLIGMLLESPHSTFYTVSKEGNLVGTITENELRPIITEYEEIRDTLIASDIAKPGVVTVFKSDNLDHIFNLFGTNNVDRFPVVTHSNPLKPIGTIWRQDVITAYNRESLKNNLTDGLANEIKSIQRNQISKVAEGYSIVESNVPTSFVGKSLSDLRLRNKYGLEVLMIKKNNPLFDEEKKSQVVVPDPNYIIKSDDVLVLFGSDENISKTNSWK